MWRVRRSLYIRGGEHRCKSNKIDKARSGYTHHCVVVIMESDRTYLANSECLILASSYLCCVLVIDVSFAGIPGAQAFGGLKLHRMKA